MPSFSLKYVEFFAKRGCSASSSRAARPLTFTARCYSSATRPTRTSKRWLAVTTCFGIGLGTGLYLGQQPGPTLDPRSFSSFVLQSKERVSSTSSIFTLVPTQGQGNQKEDPYATLWRSSLWSVQAKQPQLQIARDYTPLPPSVQFNGDPSDLSTMRILIRHEVNGEMSGYLHRLPVGRTVELRGPHKHLDIDPSIDSVVFCAGGTGIAPALQCAYALLASGSVVHLPRMHILWANRKREDCEGGSSDTVQIRRPGLWQRIWGSPSPVSPADDSHRSAIVQELELLKEMFDGKLTVDYFVDEEQSFIGSKELKDSPAMVVAKPENDSGGKQRQLVLISGPDGFISYLAGPKVVKNGLEVQGPVRGLLVDIVKGRDALVWKL